MPQNFWRSTREDYNALSFLTSNVDNCVSSIVLLCFATNLFFICQQLLNSMRCASNLPRRAARLSLSPPSVGRAIDSRLSQYINDGWVVQVSDSRYSHSGSAVQMTYFYVSFSYLILRTVAMALYAASVHDESRVARNVLYSVPAHNYQIEIHRFLVQVATDNISLTGLNFFPVTRTVLLTLAGTIVTYEVVLVQFGTTSESSSPNMTEFCLYLTRSQL
ncbi:gustatory receptor for sugar taste 64f-like [Periplaneta americana]|uniref:gustatory receptor for sugar taste 64f-like n=1 Tax=Periplaneta americana TaxID=6978 RepID=UPI0037E8B2B4